MKTRKRKQKQYTQQWQLDAAIIKLKRLAERKEKKALEWDAEFHIYDDKANDPEQSPHMAKYYGEQAFTFKKKAIVLRQQINGIIENQIPELVIKKAELATIPLPGFDPNMGVAV